MFEFPIRPFPLAHRDRERVPADRRVAAAAAAQRQFPTGSRDRVRSRTRSESANVDVKAGPGQMVTTRFLPRSAASMQFIDTEKLRDDLLATCIEFLGTVTFLLLGLGGIQAAASSNAASLAAATSSSTGGGAAAINSVASVEQLIYIATSMGLALLVAAWIFYRASGSVFNPNIGFALAIVGVLTPQRFVLYAVAELIGAIVASAILQGILPGSLAVTPSLGAGTNRAQGLWIETFTTTILCLTVLMLAAEKSAVTPFAPIGIGLALFAGQLLGVVYTGAAMNTARAFGPAVVSGFNTEHWIYWLGPTMGAGLSVIIYALLKKCHYWELNPGQDSDEPEMSPEFITRVVSSNSRQREEKDQERPEGRSSMSASPVPDHASRHSLPLQPDHSSLFASAPAHHGQPSPYLMPNLHVGTAETPAPPRGSLSTSPPGSAYGGGEQSIYAVAPPQAQYGTRSPDMLEAPTSGTPTRKARSSARFTTHTEPPLPYPQPPRSEPPPQPAYTSPGYQLPPPVSALRNKNA